MLQYHVLFIIRRPSAVLLAAVILIARRSPYALLTAAVQRTVRRKGALKSI